MAKIAFSPPVTALFTITTASTVYWSLLTDLISEKLSFALLNCILFSYLLYEIFRLTKIGCPRILANQAVLCSLMTFMLYYGFTNLLYFLPTQYLKQASAYMLITTEINKLMLGAIVGATGMWVGYWSNFSAYLTNSSLLQNMRLKYFTTKTDLHDLALALLLMIGVASRLIQISLGVYGYASSYEQYINAAAYTQYLTLGGYFCEIALTIIALQYYSHRSSLKTKIWFFSILAIEIFFGFLTGFKKLVILPIFIVMICQYILTGKVTKIWLVWVVIGLLMAYAVIEPFRAIRNQQGQKFAGNSFVAIVEAMFEATPKNTTKPKDSAVLLRVMLRTNLVADGSRGIKYADENPILPTGSPRFLENIVLAPLSAWVPRFLWPSKSLQNAGVWYTRNVIKSRALYSSTAMGMVTSLYFAGGFIAIFLGFAFIGIIQQIIMAITRPWKTGAGALVFLSTVTITSVIAEEHLDVSIVNLCRLLPIVLIIQKIIYKHPSSTKHTP